MPPDVLIDADRGHPLEPARVVDESAPAFGEDRGVGGMPGHPESGRDPGHGEVVDHDGLERPPEPAAGDLRPTLSGEACVLPPGATAVPAPVAAHPHQQRGGSVTERLVRQLSGDGVPRRAFGPASAAPRIRVNDTAFDHCPLRSQVLSDGYQAEFVEAAERRQIRRSEGSVEHVEVFQMASVGTPIIGRPRCLSRHRRAHPDHSARTLNYEEPS